MKRFFSLLVLSVFVLTVAGPAFAAKEPETRARFYDFSDQLIDGEIKKPTALYTDARKRVSFDRLMRLKKSFIPAMMQTSKEAVFK